MRFRVRTRSALIAAVLIAAGLATGQGAAMADPASAMAGPATTCTGTAGAPGTLVGNYPGDVVITGSCNIDAGPATVGGNLTVAAGASLVGIFGQNDQTHSGNSNLTVRGNMTVQPGASVMIGCYPLAVTLWFSSGLQTVPDFPCADDPNQNTPAFSATEVIDGNLTSTDPLGVVVHNTTVRGNVSETGGGAGTGCAPVGIFNQYFGLPEYSDYSNVNVGGNFLETGMDTCWWASIRNTVHGNMTISNNTGPADANEIVNNTVYGNLACHGNTPAVEAGDSNGSPNEVGGNASGECGFGVIVLNPAPESGVPPGVVPTPQPVSVPMH